MKKPVTIIQLLFRNGGRVQLASTATEPEIHAAFIGDTIVELPIIDESGVGICGISKTDLVFWVIMPAPEASLIAKVESKIKLQ